MFSGDATYDPDGPLADAMTTNTDPVDNGSVLVESVDVLVVSVAVGEADADDAVSVGESVGDAEGDGSASAGLMTSAWLCAVAESVGAAVGGVVAVEVLGVGDWSDETVSAEASTTAVSDVAYGLFS